MIIVFRFNDCQGDIGFIIEDVIGNPAFSPLHRITRDQNLAFGDIDLFSDLSQTIPAGPLDCWGDVLRADISFRQTFFIDGSQDIISHDLVYL